MGNFDVRKKEIIAYLFFGACTTAINIIIYFLFAKVLHLGVEISTVLAWVFAVIFAYYTNSRWVFENTKKHTVAFGQFIAARLFSGALDFLMMWFFVSILGINDMVIKVISNVIVIIVNYVLSKFLIFKK
jgi:Predicted membrane protein